MTNVVTHTYNEKLRTNMKLDDADDEDLELIKSFKDQFMEAMKQPSVDAEIENQMRELSREERTGPPKRYEIGHIYKKMLLI